MASMPMMTTNRVVSKFASAGKKPDRKADNPNSATPPPSSVLMVRVCRNTGRPSAKAIAKAVHSAKLIDSRDRTVNAAKGANPSNKFSGNSK